MWFLCKVCLTHAQTMNVIRGYTNKTLMFRIAHLSSEMYSTFIMRSVTKFHFYISISFSNSYLTGHTCISYKNMNVEQHRIFLPAGPKMLVYHGTCHPINMATSLLWPLSPGPWKQNLSQSISYLK